MTSARRLSRVELLPPFNLAARQIQAIEEVVELHFFRQFDVPSCYALKDLVHRQPLFLQFGNILVAVLRPDLRWLRLALGRGGGDEHLVTGHNRGRPSAPWDLERPLDVFGLRPAIGQPRMRSNGIRVRPPELRPGDFLSVNSERTQKQRARETCDAQENA